jgi:LPS sulfotransferase NodH
MVWYEPRDFCGSRVFLLQVKSPFMGYQNEVLLDLLRKDSAAGKFDLGHLRDSPELSDKAPNHPHHVRTSAVQRMFPDHQCVAKRVLSGFQGTLRESAKRASGPAFLLCIVPRSGSSLLADLLLRTGAVDRAEEHFVPSPATSTSNWMSKCADLNEVFLKLEEQSPSGYFGIKGDLYQMFPLISAGAFSGPGCIFRHIYLKRRDLVGQAISLARAVSTHEWHSHDTHVPDPDLSLEDVLYHLHYIRKMEADWELVFTALQIEPLRLYYEDLISDRAALFKSLRCYLNVQWKVDPLHITSCYERISKYYNPYWIRKLREQLDKKLDSARPNGVEARTRSIPPKTT